LARDAVPLIIHGEKRLAKKKKFITKEKYIYLCSLQVKTHVVIISKIYHLRLRTSRAMV